MARGCPACGAPHVPVRVSGARDYISLESFDIGGCAACGLLVTSDLPEGRTLASYYGPRYYGRRHSITAGFRVARRRRDLERQFPAAFQGRLLDIGCGPGDFPRAMRQAGWQVEGSEVDQAALEALRRDGIEAIDADALIRDARTGVFDAITCWHALEHTPDPAAVVRAAARLLAPGGVFQVAVPDAGSRHARWFGRYWFHYEVPRHQVHFTGRTLTAMLTREGFEVRVTSRTTAEYDWFGVVQSALNMVSVRPNVLFERITSGRFPTGAAWRDRIAACIAGPVIGVAAAPLVAAEVLTGGGASLTVSARLKGGDRRSQPAQVEERG
jgi:2-polyprenyl-3-methyl-5-hydroxy-6-metoxy-1,4-benzoquinol methylase